MAAPIKNKLPITRSKGKHIPALYARKVKTAVRLMYSSFFVKNKIPCPSFINYDIFINTVFTYIITTKTTKNTIFL